MKLHVTQRENKTMINVKVRVKNQDDGGFCKNDYVWNRSTCDCECNRSCKVDKYLDIENCSLKRSLFGKSALECED